MYADSTQSIQLMRNNKYICAQIQHEVEQMCCDVSNHLIVQGHHSISCERKRTRLLLAYNPYVLIYTGRSKIFTLPPHVHRGFHNFST